MHLRNHILLYKLFRNGLLQVFSFTNTHAEEGDKILASNEAKKKDGITRGGAFWVGQGFATASEGRVSGGVALFTALIRLISV